MIILGYVARFNMTREVFGSQDVEGFAHGKKASGIMNAWMGHRG